MLISRAWLQSLLMPGRVAFPDEAGLSSLITGLGLEVEGVTQFGAGLEAVVVGVVRGKRVHPSADKLGLVEIDDGTRTVEVVCGAGNVPDVGGRIAFAPEGAELPGGFKIGARTIRGVESRGMICSEVELGIGVDGDGIMVLPEAWAPGDRLIDRVPGIVDTVYEVSVTPNRPDALGHIGVARDVATKLGCTLVVDPLADPEPVPNPKLVTLSAPERCGRYFGYAFEGAAVGPAPLWMRVRLHRLGLRSINSVVDITNYVLMEWGQPLHAFDRARLAEGRVVVRLATDGETMTALDGAELTLTDDDLVIADAERPQALAGVMGGADSGVAEGTTTLLLEGAWFAPRDVRRTARRHQISSDSSFRFERGADHGVGLARAVARAVQLIGDHTGARLVGGHYVRGEVPEQPTVVLRPARVDRVLGMAIPTDEARRILAGLEIEVDASDPDAWSCVIPTHRPDLGIEEDLIEELMRHHGLDALPSAPAMATGYGTQAPTALRDPAGALSRAEVDALVDAFVATGCHEFVGLAFACPETLAAVDGHSVPVGVTNPMRKQHGVLRTHLLPGMLDALALNTARHGRPVRLFEIGRTYAWDSPPTGTGPTESIDRRLPTERLRAGVLLSSGVIVAGGEDAGFSAQTVSAVLCDALARVGVQAHVRPTSDGDTVACLHPGVQAELWVGGAEPRRIGHVGRVHPDLSLRWDLPEGVDAFYGELELGALPPGTPTLMVGLPRFPATSRDLSLDTAQNLPAWTVVDALRHAASTLKPSAEDAPKLAPGDRTNADVEVLEDYRGKGIDPGRRALLLRLHYRAAERSVKDAEVQSVHDALVDAALSALRSTDPSVQRR